MTPDAQTAEVYERLVAELTREPGVTFPRSQPGARNTFGSNALHVNGKIFCMVDARGRFVVKLPQDLVQALLADGRGARFEMGKARWMKEWVVLVPGTEALWHDFARQALGFVRQLHPEGRPLTSSGAEGAHGAAVEGDDAAHQGQA